MQELPPLHNYFFYDLAKMAKHRIYTMSFASVYPFYVAKAEKKSAQKLKSMRPSAGLQDIPKRD